MKNVLTAVALVAATATTAAAHTCGIADADIKAYPGYAQSNGDVYDRGDYLFTSSTERFNESISYKHWNKVEAITVHTRIYKDDCRVSEIEIVHPESKPEQVIAAPTTVVEPAPVINPAPVTPAPVTVADRNVIVNFDMVNGKGHRLINRNVYITMSDGTAITKNVHVKIHKNGKKKVFTIDNQTTQKVFKVVKKKNANGVWWTKSRTNITASSHYAN